MTPQQNISLTSTLALPATARYYGRYQSTSELLSWLGWAQQQGVAVRPLGGGSNVLLAPEVDALVLQSDMCQVQVVHETECHRWVLVDGGCDWHSWVVDSAHYGHGLENLALIPGTVGAAPIQNIGAYGVELAEWVAWVEGVQLSTRQWQRWSAQDCRFAYRDSIFKRELRGDVIITRVCFRLSRRFEPNLSYQPLAEWSAGAQVTPHSLREAVCAIRRSKLPDPAELANAGSFFKNPVVAQPQAQLLQQRWPQMPTYPAQGGVKLAAGWLIEQAGWKGRRLGKVGMHRQQALVLVNYGGASLGDIEALVRQVQTDVWQRFKVALEPEPQRF
ncbi:UDP-N-acetylenolpyruvoylglucosamine reductase [Bacterioplanes sanyensis]|uniref:UDP-N-acetylmuramate dehydrogenase n=1 Tax=Bacterioplanes sanyensis TaxID=1249553 RepID=UPI0016748AB4|nr:UDP-N-acetylmuramate dehydrogenase [Bacterioplanes sanyensis]GGY54167.1 UDP-N-acetylenolpyruvoylglucosamine reductase [Bacterioplanes sanyensis]